MTNRIAKYVKGAIVLLAAAGFNIEEMYKAATLAPSTTGALVAIGGGIAGLVYFWEGKKKRD